MNFLGGSLYPENQEKLVITCAPYGPQWTPSDFFEDIPITMDEQVQKAVDCQASTPAPPCCTCTCVNSMARAPSACSKFNELDRRSPQGGARHAFIQVGGSISFAPETAGEVAKWLSDDTRHLLAELDPKPDQVTVAIANSQPIQPGGDDDRCRTSPAPRLPSR